MYITICKLFFNKVDFFFNQCPASPSTLAHTLQNQVLSKLSETLVSCFPTSISLNIHIHIIIMLCLLSKYLRVLIRLISTGTSPLLHYLSPRSIWHLSIHSCVLPVYFPCSSQYRSDDGSPLKNCTVLTMI